MSIRARLLVALLTGVTLMVVVGGASLYLFTARRLEAEFRDALRHQAQTLAATVVIDRGQLEVESAPADSPGFPLLYRIIGPDGESLAEAGRFDWVDGPPALPKPAAWIWAPVGLPGDEDGLALVYGFRPGAERVPGSDIETPHPRLLVWVAAVRSTRSVKRSIATIGSAITGFGVLALFTTTVIVWIGVRAGLRPLDKYVDSIESLDPQALEWQRPSPGTPAELRPAYEALSRALGRVRAAMARERRFTDAAAHELRTPVAELRTLLDVAKRWPEQDRVIRSLGRANGVLTNMTELIESLLMLSRSSNDVSEQESERESLSKIAAEEVDRVTDRAEAAGVAVSTRIAEDWNCPRLYGQIIVRNLLDNAIEYTPPGGRVDIEVDDGALRVSNAPVHLRAEQIDHLFEPFWRAEDSRSDRRHHGLGLAIVSHAAEGCGMTCRVESNGDTLAFVVSVDDRTKRRDDGAPERMTARTRRPSRSSIAPRAEDAEGVAPAPTLR